MLLVEVFKLALLMSKQVLCVLEILSLGLALVNFLKEFYFGLVTYFVGGVQLVDSVSEVLLCSLQHILRFLLSDVKRVELDVELVQIRFEFIDLLLLLCDTFFALSRHLVVPNHVTLLIL